MSGNKKCQELTCGHMNTVLAMRDSDGLFVCPDCILKEDLTDAQRNHYTKLIYKQETAKRNFGQLT